MRLFFNSMRGQLFILLTLGITGSVAITLFLAYGQQKELLINARAQHLAQNIATLVETLDVTAPDKRNDMLLSVHPMGVRGHWGDDITQNSLHPFDPALQLALENRLGEHYSPYASIPGAVPCRRNETNQVQHYPNEPQCQLVLLKLSDGSPLQLTVFAPRILPPPHPSWWVALIFFTLIALLAYLAARMATRPLQQLGDAADQLDLADDVASLAEHGSGEVRTAIRAFNHMRQRIRDDLRERTGMLAAITHDLQTPLTRLRLRLEKVADAELRDKLIADMTATQQMLQEGLEFARSLDASEGMQELDLDSLLDSLCTDASDSGQEARYVGLEHAHVRAHPQALRRAFSNILDNALKYGQRAEVAMRCKADLCHITIRDYGTGIPQDELEKVFAPFYRLEQSRSRSTGGTGLGLAIARNILRQHGGSISLRNHPECGLVAQITLPLKS